MDLSSISSAYEGLRIGKDLLKGLFELKVEAEVKDQVDEVLSKLGEAQDTLFTMREELFRLQAENNTLQSQLNESTKWDEKFASYQLEKTIGGAIVYKSKFEPEHFACPSCIENKGIHILQDKRTRSGEFSCSNCQAKFPIKLVKSHKPIQVF
jgi:regulator of replication initiation timing